MELRRKWQNRVCNAGPFRRVKTLGMGIQAWGGGVQSCIVHEIATEVKDEILCDVCVTCVKTI
jgi:hypothetical protein